MGSIPEAFLHPSARRGSCQRVGAPTGLPFAFLFLSCFLRIILMSENKQNDYAYRARWFPTPTMLENALFCLLAVAFFLLAMHKSPCVFVRSWLVEPASLHYVANDNVLLECIRSPCISFDY